MQGMRKLRILALHGGMQDADSFKGKMKNTIKWTRDVAEYEFANAPFPAICPDFSRCSEDDIQNGVFKHWEAEAGESKRSWWGWNPHDASDKRYACCSYHQEGLVYQNIDTSLDLLHRLWIEKGPFDGIFGFSQGGVLASIFTEMLERNAQEVKATGEQGAQIPSVPRFLVLVSAFLNPVPLNLPKYWCDDDSVAGELDKLGKVCGEDGTLAPIAPADHFFQPLEYVEDEQCSCLPLRESISQVPSLHIWGSNDKIMPPARSRFLSSRFADAQVHQHNFRRGHEVPQDRADVEVLGAFLRAQQERLNAERAAP